VPAVGLAHDAVPAPGEWERGLARAAVDLEQPVAGLQPGLLASASNNRSGDSGTIVWVSISDLIEDPPQSVSVVDHADILERNPGHVRKAMGLRDAVTDADPLGLRTAAMVGLIGGGASRASGTFCPPSHTRPELTDGDHLMTGGHDLSSERAAGILTPASSGSAGFRHAP